MLNILQEIFLQSQFVQDTLKIGVFTWDIIIVIGGTNWGDDGWFRIKLGEQTLGIETLCFWGMNDDWKK